MIKLDWFVKLLTVSPICIRGEIFSRLSRLKYPINKLPLSFQGIRKVQQCVATNALQKIGATLKRMDVEGVYDMLVFDTDEYWECLLRHYADTVYHPASSCRIGAENDPTAVVDINLRHIEKKKSRF